MGNKFKNRVRLDQNHEIVEANQEKTINKIVIVDLRIIATQMSPLSIQITIDHLIKEFRIAN